ncbi:MAG: recombinase family protein [Vulcanisaeta sp.]|nr:recombinase family protein [Vulcanisaeta sp.]MCG2869938.1 recombinase family protein [Vulcanisaeta sp.]MCG2880216.1 recombinase family protein [Vulcanisaeta sp.]MCG2887184.1 recombinase family protein [Vulcanisaeta sp.]MCG2892736.1 recombinase family protein [Vulcanisaeta sp.]
MIPAISYVRVSTEEQDPANQVDYLRRWAASRGFNILKFYIDEAVSGASPILERPAFRELVRDVEGGALTPRPMVLLVYETSRLVRNFQELFRLLDIVENRLGLLIVSASEKESVLQNLDGTYRQFLRTVLAFVASMEREFIRQRTKVAMERLRREGKLVSKVESLPADVINEIVRLYNEGLSQRAVADRLGVSLYVVRRVLSKYGLRGAYTCPRCLHRMRVVDRALVQVDGRYAIKQILHCPNCGYEEVRIE